MSPTIIAARATHSLTTRACYDLSRAPRERMNLRVCAHGAPELCGVSDPMVLHLGRRIKILRAEVSTAPKEQGMPEEICRNPFFSICAYLSSFMARRPAVRNMSECPGSLDPLEHEQGNGPSFVSTRTARAESRSSGKRKLSLPFHDCLGKFEILGSENGVFQVKGQDPSQMTRPQASLWERIFRLETGLQLKAFSCSALPGTETQAPTLPSMAPSTDGP